MRRLGHALLPAGDDDSGIAGADLLGGQRHGAQAGAAELVDAEGGAPAGMPAAMAAWRAGFWPGAGGQDLAEDDLVHFVRLRSRRAAIAAWMAMVPSACADRLAKAPLKLPTGVRAAEAMTISVMTGISHPDAAPHLDPRRPSR